MGFSGGDVRAAVVPRARTCDLGVDRRWNGDRRQPRIAGSLGSTALMIAFASIPGAVIDPTQMVSLFLLGLGVALGGGITVTATVDTSFVSGLDGSLSLIPLGSLAAVVGVVSVLSWWRSRHDRSVSPHSGAELARAVIEAAGIALVATLLTAFAAYEDTMMLAGLEFRTRPGLVFLTLMVTVSVTLFAIREWRRRRISGARERAAALAAREGALYLIVQFVAFGLAALIFSVIASAHLGNVAPFFAGLPLLVNLAELAAALGMFGAVGYSLDRYATTTSGVFDVDNGLWLILVAVIVTITAAGVIGIRRLRTHVPIWSRVWQMPLIVFVAWCALALGPARFSASGEALSILSMSGTVSAGVTWWTPLLAGLWAAAASIAAEFLPTLVHRANPAILVLLGGRRQAEMWVRGEDASAPTPPVQDGIETGSAELAEEGGGAETGRAAGGESPLSREPLTPRARRILIASSAVVGGIVLLVIAGSITVGLVNQSRDPASVVRSYLELIAEGRADEANRVVDPGLRNDERVLLTDDALGEAEQRIEVVEVRTIERSPAGASVEATMALDGERFEKTFFVAPGPKELWVLDTWELQEAMVVPVSVGSTGLDAVTVGDVEVSLEDEEAVYSGHRSRDLYAYPGLYAATAPETDYVTPSNEPLRVTPVVETGLSIGVDVTAEPSEAFVDSVLTQVQERITQCVQVPTNMDDVCPYVTRHDDLTEMTVVAQTEGFDAITLDFFQASDATIAVRESPSLFDREPDLDEFDIGVSGTIVLEDGKPVISDLSMSRSW